MAAVHGQNHDSRLTMIIRAPARRMDKSVSRSPSVGYTLIHVAGAG
jgi:hypothetical protein